MDFTSPTSLGSRVQVSLNDEVAHNPAFISNTALVPDPLYDTDGRFTFDPDGIDGAGDGETLTGIPKKRNYLETVKGRPTVVCGLNGSTTARVADCAIYNTSGGVNRAHWDGSKFYMGGEGDWKLVTLYKSGAAAGSICSGGAAAGCFEVWQDQRTLLVWSDTLTNGGGFNWFQAAGYSKSSTTVNSTSYEGAGPTVAGGGRIYNPSNCANRATSTCQDDVPLSACADAAALVGKNGIATYQNPDGSNGTVDERPAKGMISGANANWRLPTKEDFQLAELNGMRRVLPNMDECFWSATSFSYYRARAWYYCGEAGFINGTERHSLNKVICVGR